MRLWEVSAATAVFHRYFLLPLQSILGLFLGCVSISVYAEWTPKRELQKISQITSVTFHIGHTMKNKLFLQLFCDGLLLCWDIILKYSKLFLQILYLIESILDRQKNFPLYYGGGSFPDFVQFFSFSWRSSWSCIFRAGFILSCISLYLTYLQKAVT